MWESIRVAFLSLCMLKISRMKSSYIYICKYMFTHTHIHTHIYNMYIHSMYICVWCVYTHVICVCTCVYTCVICVVYVCIYKTVQPVPMKARFHWPILPCLASVPGGVGPLCLTHGVSTSTSPLGTAEGSTELDKNKGHAEVVPDPQAFSMALTGMYQPGNSGPQLWTPSCSFLVIQCPQELNRIPTF